MILPTIVVALCLGIAAQILADRIRLPAILPLLVFGIFCGPFGLGWIDPASLGHGLEVLVHLGVAIILFEGGLSLDLRQLSRVGGVVRNLLTLGCALTGVLAAVLANALTGMSWSLAALFGAIVTVTGPTVVAPLLRHFVAPRSVKTVLMSEGLIVDPIGAVLAYLVLQWIERAGMAPQQVLREIAAVAITGSVLGFATGSLVRFLTRNRIVGAELRNLTILSLLMAAYLLAESQAPQSGVLLAVVMGLTMSGSAFPDLLSVKTFKEQLTTLLISLLFILLSGKLDLGEMTRLGWRGVAVAVLLVLLVRPLSVWISVWPSHLPWGERATLALIAPRGIVAAAVASLSALELTERGIDGGAALEGLVYTTIIVSCLAATAMALVLPRWLGFLDDPSRRRTVFVGATALTTTLAKTFAPSGRHGVVVDGSPHRLAAMTGLSTVLGDARDPDTLERAGVERDTLVICATANDELNLLVSELVHHEFSVAHPVVLLQEPPERFGVRSRAWAELFGGRAVALQRWLRRLEDGSTGAHELSLGDPSQRQAVRHELDRLGDDVLVVCGWKGSEPELDTAKTFESAERLSVISGTAKAAAALRQLAQETEEEDGSTDKAEGEGR